MFEHTLNIDKYLSCKMSSTGLVLKVALGIFLCTTGFILVRCFFYLYFEFMEPSHVYTRQFQTPDPNIPQHIHQVFFLQKGYSEIPERFRKAQTGCIDVNKGYNFTLWTESMVEELIRTKYPEMASMYKDYGRWVSRTNVARYLIIHHYGGWYMDMDTQCHSSIEPLRQKAMAGGKSFVVRPTNPAGISNDFFGASPQHPFLDDVLSALPHSNMWFIFPYATNVFSTGTTFFWGRFMNYGHNEQFYMLEDFDTYFEPLHASTWHEWDGKILVHFYTHSEHAYILFFAIFCVLALTLRVVCCKNSCSDIADASDSVRSVMRWIKEHVCKHFPYGKVSLNDRRHQCCHA